MHLSKPPLGTPLDWSNPLNKGLVLHLGMNEGNGDKVQDLSMYGNHGKMHDFAFPPTVASGWNPGQTGIGLNFDGVNDRITCGDQASLDIQTDLSVSACVRIGAVSPISVIATKFNRSDYTAPYNLYIFDAVPRFAFGTGTGWKTAISSQTLDTDKWYNVVGTISGTALKIYVDSVLTGTGTFVGTRQTLDKLTIGYDGSERYLNGSIDQPRIHNRALSAKEVMDYYINPWQVYLDEDE